MLKENLIIGKIDKMTHEEKINYMKIATAIAGYGFEHKILDMLVSIYELVIEKEGKTDLKMVCEIEAEVKKRAEKISSTKVDTE